MLIENTSEKEDVTSLYSFKLMFGTLKLFSIRSYSLFPMLLKSSVDKIGFVKKSLGFSGEYNSYI